MSTIDRRFWTAARCAVAAVFISLLTTSPAGAQPNLQSALAACMNQARELPADTVIALREQCPGLHEALTANSRIEALAPPLGDHVTAGRLWDIYDFFVEPDAPLSPRLHADHAVIEQILNEFRGSAPAPDPDWIERLLAWLKEVLGDRADPDLAWLENLVETLSQYQDAFAMFAYATLLLLAAMAAWLLIRLIPYKRWRTTVRDWQVPRSPRAAAQPLALHTIRAMPAASQAPALLAYVLQELVGSGRLPADRSLTNREFGRLLEQRERSAAPLFRQLCEFVERQLYGGQLLDRGELTTCFEAAGTLTAGTTPRATADA